MPQLETRQPLNRSDGIGCAGVPSSSSLGGHLGSNPPSRPSQSRKRTRQSSTKPAASGVVRRTTRTCFSDSAKTSFVSWIDSHEGNLYPTTEELMKLVEETGYELKKIRGWFQNNRRLKPIPSVPSTKLDISGHCSSNECYSDGLSRALPLSEGDLSRYSAEPLESSVIEQELWHRQTSLSLDRFVETKLRDGPSPLSTYGSIEPKNKSVPFTRRTCCGSPNEVARPAAVTEAASKMPTQHSHRSSLLLSHSSNKTVADPAPGRKGKQKIPRKYPPQRQGEKRYQCTYTGTVCNQGFLKSADWRRHMRSKHGLDLWQSTCMPDGPWLTDNMGKKTCAFCGTPDPDDNHLEIAHSAYECWKKPSIDRTYPRADGLWRHARDIHKASPTVIPKSWTKPIEENLSCARWCGFCCKFVLTWMGFENHVIEHFEDKFRYYDMTMWIKEPVSNDDTASWIHEPALNLPTGPSDPAHDHDLPGGSDEATFLHTASSYDMSDWADETMSDSWLGSAFT